MRATHARQIRAGINAARSARVIGATEPLAVKIMLAAWAAWGMGKLTAEAASREWKRGEA